MISRMKNSVPLFLFLLSWSIIVTALDGTFNCQDPLLVGDLKFDLSSLDKEFSADRERPTPPSVEVDTVKINLCSDLKKVDSLPEGDQCPLGTRVCFTKTNKKDGADRRVVSVIPMAQSSVLDPSYKQLSSPKGVSILLHGASYSHPINVTETPQSVNVKLLCATDSESEPSIASYDGAMLEIEWHCSAGCNILGDGGSPVDDGEKPEKDKTGSGGLSSMGWFLLLLLILAFATYMGLGAYYNYSTYGARGMDLIPHRDFWMEVPYMLRDVVSHLCSVVRPRRSSHRGGYIAV
ncbi:autophagy-related protein 27 [Mycena pura]|uniref:Autophagy-related protein 27 n=1 Tax=Mycena pura TaxID=153505 RepID=A0AAD6VNA3_9AGAR|nr:autophagy-related protein 27 [Mycena pura]